jgi:hypothetical protein
MDRKTFMPQVKNLQIFLFILLVLFVFTLSQSAFAAQIRLAWDPNTESDLAGYKVYYGTEPWSFGEPKKLKKLTTFTLTGLTKGERYYIALTAYDRTNHESWFSNQVDGIAHDILYGEWVLDISGAANGGAVIRFEDENNTYSGYGISDKLNFFGIEGTYNIGEGEVIFNGDYRVYDFHNLQSVLSTGNMNGQIDKKGTTLTLSMDGLSLNMKGTPFLKDPLKPNDPVISKDWEFKITGATKGEIDPLEIKPYAVNGELNSHVFELSGSGVTISQQSMDIIGFFLLTPKNKLYGIYEIDGAISDEGFFSGSFDRNITKFSGKSLSDNKNRYNFTGQAKTSP